MLSFIKDVLYNLNSEYGFPISFYKILSTSVDVTTGAKTTVTKRYSIRKATVLPSVYLRKVFSQVLSNNSPYGSEYDVNTKAVVIEYSDISVPITLDDYIIYSKRRYNIKNIEQLEQNAGYLLTVKATEGIITYETLEENVSNAIKLEQRALNG